MNDTAENLALPIHESIVPMTCPEIVSELDRFIIGQQEAKRAVAVALRNRWRRQQVPEKLRNEITPKNILMIGPTGVGKTEIARRLAKLANAPFIKVEATKFTEVGYVGRDVESIVRDLADAAVKLARETAMKKVRSLAEDGAEERILDALLSTKTPAEGEPESEQDTTTQTDSKTRQLFRKKLREGELDDKTIEIELRGPSVSVEFVTPPGMEEMANQLQGLFQNMGSERAKTRKLTIKDAKKLIADEEGSKLINEEEIKVKAMKTVEQNGIVFLDELDKVAQDNTGARSGADVSRGGVQRDLLPLLEGCTVTTRYGTIQTDHILFIASGAFHLSKPSDLIPELQGRLPIRVELNALSADDFERILTEPDASLTEQYTELLKTEGVTLNIDEKGIKRVAQIAWQVNEHTENIGARRLYTVMERLLEKISFEATELSGETITVDEAYVNEQLEKLADNEDWSRSIL